MPDAHANFVYSTVATAPSPATSGLTLVVAGGAGAAFNALPPPFNATVSPANATAAQIATLSEIIRVMSISTDTFTMLRAQEGTAARTIVVGDQISVTMTRKAFADVERYTRIFAQQNLR